MIDREALGKNAERVVTTEKDWVKMKSRLPEASRVSIGVVQLEVRFRESEGEGLLELMLAKVGVGK